MFRNRHHCRSVIANLASRAGVGVCDLINYTNKLIAHTKHAAPPAAADATGAAAADPGRPLDQLINLPSVVSSQRAAAAATPRVMTLMNRLF